MPRRRLSLLSTDFHTGPIADVKDLLVRHPSLNANVVDLSLSQACKHAGTCADESKLKVLRNGDTAHSMYFSRQTRLEFFDAYRKNDGKSEHLISQADAVICSHPTGMCELYMPFNTSIILWATTRFEQGREHDPDRLRGLIKNVRAIAAQPWNAVMANNWYDVHYINYFTGVMPTYVPSLCAYIDASYTWSAPVGKAVWGYRSSWATMEPSRTIVVFGYRPANQIGGWLHEFLKPLNDLSSGQGLDFEFGNVHDVYKRRYEYSELAAHPAVMHMPYQVSVMSFYEQYRMGIPIIVPSLDLLTRWHMDMLMVSERCWKLRKGSIVDRHPESKQKYDPNDDKSYAAVSHWLQYSDYYIFPHVILFDSWDDLLMKLKEADLVALSAKMKEYSRRLEEMIVDRWDAVLDQAATARHKALPLDGQYPAGLEEDYASRMNAVFGKDSWAAY